jgi:rfaE bifunctional protein nucleotidyltransferase chain/domain
VGDNVMDDDVMDDDVMADTQHVLATGVFDVLHVGHLRLLEWAASRGNVLTVGINSDASAQALGKGAGRPVNSAWDRAAMLRALRCVDRVVVFTEPTPERLIALLRPDVLVKGGDYREDDLPEAALVRSYGGRVLIFPSVLGHSTTETLRKLAAT